MKPTNLLIIGGAVVLGGIYLSTKVKKGKSDANTQAVNNSQVPLNTATQSTQTTQTTENTSTTASLGAKLTPAEATKKALEVVTKWISLLDAIPKEALTEENKNFLNQKISAEKERLAKFDYDKALALAKSQNASKFSIGDTTYWTVNEQDVRNGSFGTTNPVPNIREWTSAFQTLMQNLWIPSKTGIYYANSFKDARPIKSMLMLSSLNEPITLGDYVKKVKQIDFSKIYDVLKLKFTEIPKSDVDRLVILLPKYLFVANDDFKYYQNYLQQNPFTIEEQLYLKDINMERLFSVKKPMATTTYNIIN